MWRFCLVSTFFIKVQIKCSCVYISYLYNDIIVQNIGENWSILYRYVIQKWTNISTTTKYVTWTKPRSVDILVETN